MRKIFFVLPILTLLLSIHPEPAQAHPADLYAHNIHVDISQTGLKIEWQIKPGPLLVNFIWNEKDVNADGILSDDELNTWAGSYTDLMTATLDDKPFPLLTDSVQFPTDLQSFQAGDEFITITLTADWPQDSENAQKLIITNGMEITKSINWYYLNTSDHAAFLFPSQKNHIITVDFVHDSSLFSDQTTLLTAWDSGTPSMPLGQEKDVVTQTAEQVVPELAERTPQEILLDLLRQKEFSLPFYLFALVIALALGALHALTPGHGKTVVAAYLVGSRGTTWHAIVLGSVVTLTHTGSVFLLGIITLAASQYILPTTIIPFLEILSGLLIVGLGLYLLWQRFLFWRKSISATPVVVSGAGGRRKVSLSPALSSKVSGSIKIQQADSSLHHHGDGKIHSHNVPEAITWRSLIALGVSGGLVPCPDAIAILLVAIAINRILLGLALIISFSLGLAVVLIVIGLLMVNSRRLFNRIGFLDKLAPVMPMVSAIIVLLLGFGLTWGAYARAKDNVSFAVPGSGSALSRVEGSASEAQVLYLAEDENRVRHLFITDFENDTSRIVSEENQNVVSYAVSPDNTMAAYISENDNETSELWLLDLESMERRKLSATKNVTISNLVWSPNSQRIVYEHTDANGSEASQTTLWWIDVNGKDQPVFQEAGVPGKNLRWSPNGQWLSYATDEGIRLYQLEDGQSRLIKNILGAALEWSPDSKSVLLRDVVIEFEQFVTQLFLYDIDTEMLINLDPNGSVENLFAAWSPTGEYIAVTRRDLSIPRGDQIWLMNSDGSNAHALTDTPEVLHGNLSWSPDGKYLLYDIFMLENYPFDYRLQVINMDEEEIVDMNIKGFNPQWIWR